MSSQETNSRLGQDYQIAARIEEDSHLARKEATLFRILREAEDSGRMVTTKTPAQILSEEAKRHVEYLATLEYNRVSRRFDYGEFFPSVDPNKTGDFLLKEKIIRDSLLEGNLSQGVASLSYRIEDALMLISFSNGSAQALEKLKMDIPQYLRDLQVLEVALLDSTLPEVK